MQFNTRYEILMHMENQNPQPTVPVQEPNLAPVSTVSQTIPPSPRSKSKIILALIIIFIVLFFGSAAAIGMKVFSDINNEKVLVSTPTPTQTIKSTTDLLSYENTTYGFTAKYPKDWKILPSSQDSGITFAGPPDGSGEASKPALVSIQVLETAKLQPGWESNYAISPFSSKTLTNGDYTYYITANTFTIGGQPSEETKKLAIDTMSQILSTFKFTNSNMYINNDLGFEFSIPKRYKLQSETEKSAIFSGTFEPGSQVIPSELIVNFKPTINSNSIKICDNAPQIGRYQCLDNAPRDITINNVKYKEIYLREGEGDSMSSSRYIIQAVNAPQIEFTHAVLGGGIEENMNSILSTLKFTK